MSKYILSIASAAVVLSLIIIFSITETIPTAGETHRITLTTEYVIPSHGLDKEERDILAYKMVSHIIEDDVTGDYYDVTSQRYGDNPAASVPGPIIKINQYDSVELTLQNGLRDGCVSVHTHGLQYPLSSDGTLETINEMFNQCATTNSTATYNYYAGEDSVGVWPYHDHTYCSSILQDRQLNCEKFEGITGAEEIGLYGMFIVDGATVTKLIDGEVGEIPTEDVAMDYILFMDGNPQFHGTAINNTSGLQTPLGVNPTLLAEYETDVRFTIAGVGSPFHTFHLHGTKWLEPGTTHVIDTKTIGPMTVHTFTINTGDYFMGPGNWQYHCHVFDHMASGMAGIFRIF